jgi:hypothetical protein
MEAALNQATNKDSTDNAAVQALNQQAVDTFEASKTSEGYTLTLIALCFEVVFLLCLIFNWGFYWNCYVECAAIEGNQQAVNKQPKQQQEQPQQQQEEEQPQQRPTIVQGFLQRQKQGITSAVNTSAVNTSAVKFTRHCDHCSAPFVHKVHNQKFCKEKCRIKAWEKKTGTRLKKKQKAPNRS